MYMTAFLPKRSTFSAEVQKAYTFTTQAAFKIHKMLILLKFYLWSLILISYVDTFLMSLDKKEQYPEFATLVELQA